MSRSKARKERDALRTARRDSLLILLSRAQRGVLSRPEAEQLRVPVEAELTLADQTRASAGGQQAALQRVQQQLTAAHEAIVEAEQRAERAEQRLDDVRANLCRVLDAPDAEARLDDLLATWRSARAQDEQRVERAEAAVERVREAARRHGPTLTADEIEHALAEQQPAAATP